MPWMRQIEGWCLVLTLLRERFRLMPVKEAEQMTETLRNAQAEIREQLVNAIEVLKEYDRMQEIIKLHQGLNTLEELTGDPRTSLSEIFAEAFGFETDSALHVRPGEFFGRDQLKAAKMYLKRKGEKGASFREIVRAIKDGGAKVTSEEKLKVSLGRSTLDIAKVGLEHYALLEFFPHAQRGNKRRKSESETEADETDEMNTADDDLIEQNDEADDGTGENIKDVASVAKATE